MSWYDIYEMEEAKELIWVPYVEDKSNFGYSKELDWIDFRGKSVLDFGCGIGRNLNHICDRAAFTVGYDFKNMTNMAIGFLKDKANKIIFVNPPVLSLTNFNFDIIVAVLVFQHMTEKDLREALVVFQRCLDIQGQLFVIDRSWMDEDRKETWLIVDDYFKTVSSDYEPTNKDRHQAVFFRKRRKEDG